MLTPLPPEWARSSKQREIEEDAVLTVFLCRSSLQADIGNSKVDQVYQYHHTDDVEEGIYCHHPNPVYFVVNLYFIASVGPRFLS